MEWKVTKSKRDMRLFNNDMSSEIVKAGTRVLIAIDEDGVHYCPLVGKNYLRRRLKQNLRTTNVLVITIQSIH